MTEPFELGATEVKSWRAEMPQVHFGTCQQGDVQALCDRCNAEHGEKDARIAALEAERNAALVRVAELEAARNKWLEQEAM